MKDPKSILDQQLMKIKNAEEERIKKQKQLQGTYDKDHDFQFDDTIEEVECFEYDIDFIKKNSFTERVTKALQNDVVDEEDFEDNKISKNQEESLSATSTQISSASTLNTCVNSSIGSQSTKSSSSKMKSSKVAESDDS